jgi:hypothetical protein
LLYTGITEGINHGKTGTKAVANINAGIKPLITQIARQEREVAIEPS